MDIIKQPFGQIDDMTLVDLYKLTNSNEMEVRISMCQIGMFGYAVKGHPAYRTRQAAEHVPDDVAAAIRSATVDGRIACDVLWRIAEEHDLSRLEAGNAIEGLGIRAKPCQLGCF